MGQTRDEHTLTVLPVFSFRALLARNFAFPTNRDIRLCDVVTDLVSFCTALTWNWIYVALLIFQSPHIEFSHRKL